MVLKCTRWSPSRHSCTALMKQYRISSISRNFLETLITETEFNKAQCERRNWHFAFYLRTSDGTFDPNELYPHLTANSPFYLCFVFPSNLSPSLSLFPSVIIRQIWYCKRSLIWIIINQIIEEWKIWEKYDRFR